MNSSNNIELLFLRSKIKTPFYLTVSGTSMFPILNDGDIISVCSQESYEIGDILVFVYKGDELIVHRLLKIQNGRLFCKGDNSFRLEDITPENIIGKVMLDNDVHNNGDFIFESLKINKLLRLCRYDIEKTKDSFEYRQYKEKYLR